MKEEKQYRQFYGSTTLGEKGQIVIPAEAREFMKLKKGEKLLVFGMGCDMVAFSKLIHVEKFAQHLSARLEHVRKIIHQNGR